MQAFTKREIPQNYAPVIGTSLVETGKKSTEWFLEEFAYDGVESTTRYRKLNGSKSRRSGAIPSPSSQRHPYRTTPGRKLGSAVPKTRAAPAAARPSRTYLHRNTKGSATFQDGAASFYDSPIRGHPTVSEEPRTPDNDGLGLGPLYHGYMPMIGAGYDAYGGDPQQPAPSDAAVSGESYYDAFATDVGAFADNSVGSYLGGDEYDARACGPMWMGGEQQGCRY